MDTSRNQSVNVTEVFKVAAQKSHSILLRGLQRDMSVYVPATGNFSEHIAVQLSASSGGHDCYS